MFIKGKLIVDDESYNILRYENGKYQKVAKNGMAYTNVITNPYVIEIETTSETNLFAWAASKAIMKPVRIVLSHPSEMERPRTIQLYDTLCVGYDCYFNAIDTRPMITRLVLSPAIVVENGEPITEQPWKVTDLSQQNNNGQVQQRNNVENNEDAIELLVKKLEGPFTEDGSKKVEELIMGNTYIYKATEYNDGDNDKLTNTQWSVELNNDGKLKQLKQSDASEKDGVICFKYTPEKAENIRMYAWCQGASKDVSVEVPVVSFPFYLDRYKKAGFNRTGTAIADDLCYGDGVHLNTGHSIYSIDEINNLTGLFKIQLEATEESLWIDFRTMTDTLFSVGEMEDVANDMINHFKGNTGEEYSNQILTNHVINHPSCQRFCASMEKLILERYKHKNLLSSIENTKIHYDDELWGHPRFNTLKDTFIGGLTICMNDTWAYEVSITDAKIQNESLNIKYKVSLYDHFGLDKPDMEKIYRFGAGFRAWFVLQHVKNFKPFITKVSFDKELKILR